MELVSALKITIIILIFIVMILSFVFFYLILKRKKTEKTEKTSQNQEKSKDNSINKDRDSIYKFMEFDEIKDNMIIRKNRTQYIMIVRCKGINYDLMSEEEKIAVESGFVQFLNTLRFPVQLYVQTTSLNLRDIIEDYKNRIEDMRKDIQRTEQKIISAKSEGNVDLYNKLNFEKRRKENVLEYGADISEYIARMSTNQNVLQQKNYLVVSYYTSEIGHTENSSKEEIDNLCFSELYTRTQTTLRALGSSGVMGKILDSEELAELLYVAYNRDESEIMQLSKAIESQYDSLYSTGKDVLEKREEAIKEIIERESVELATESIKIADQKIKNEKKIMKKALEIIEEYKDQMSDELYEQTKKEIKNEKGKQE